MNEARMCQLRALLNEKWGPVERNEPVLYIVGRDPNRTAHKSRLSDLCTQRNPVNKRQGMISQTAEHSISIEDVAGSALEAVGIDPGNNPTKYSAILSLLTDTYDGKNQLSDPNQMAATCLLSVLGATEYGYEYLRKFLANLVACFQREYEKKVKRITSPKIDKSENDT